MQLNDLKWFYIRYVFSLTKGSHKKEIYKLLYMLWVLLQYYYCISYMLYASAHMKEEWMFETHISSEENLFFFQ